MTHAFTITLKAGNRVREFNFTRVPHDPKTCYSVNVVNDNNARIGFQMRETENGQWAIFDADALPDWVVVEKDKLQEALNEEARKAPVSWLRGG